MTANTNAALLANLWEAISYHSVCIRETGHLALSDKLINAMAAVESALTTAAQPPAGHVLVPIELAERVQETMGEFLMDHGWRQQDMDTSDEFGALLAAAPNPHVQIPPENVHIDCDVSKKVGNVDTFADPKETKAEPAQQPKQIPLTDEEIELLAEKHLQAFAEFQGEAGETWMEGEIEFAKAILEAAAAQQPKRVPLTREQVNAIAKESGYLNGDPENLCDFINGIRHGESAHGIQPAHKE